MTDCCDPHRDHDAGYECECGVRVCPTCEVSPGEAAEMCTRCWWFSDDDGPEAA